MRDPVHQAFDAWVFAQACLFSRPAPDPADYLADPVGFTWAQDEAAIASETETESALADSPA
jgi:hypothetical protein